MRQDKPCDSYCPHHDVSWDMCQTCMWSEAAHCGNSYHNAGNFGGTLPCSDGPLCVLSFEYKHEKKLTNLVERLETATGKREKYWGYVPKDWKAQARLTGFVNAIGVKAEPNTVRVVIYEEDIAP